MVFKSQFFQKIKQLHTIILLRYNQIDNNHRQGAGFATNDSAVG